MGGQSRRYRRKWNSYAKGGEYRKWYGNLDYVIDWSDEAKLFYKTNSTSSLLPEEYWFKDGITYTELTTRGFNGRLLPSTALFDMAGPSLIINDKQDRTFYLHY